MIMIMIKIKIKMNTAKQNQKIKMKNRDLLNNLSLINLKINLHKWSLGKNELKTNFEK